MSKDGAFDDERRNTGFVESRDDMAKGLPRAQMHREGQGRVDVGVERALPVRRPSPERSRSRSRSSRSFGLSVSFFRGGLSHRRAGSCIDGVVWLSIGGLTIEMRDADASTRDLVSAHWPEFVVDAAPHADVSIEITSDPSMKALWSSSTSGDLAVRRDEEGRWHFDRADFRGQWSPEQRKASVRYAGELPFLSSFLRVLCCSILSMRRGVLLHASSVATSKGVVVFPGPSGTGKSTVAGLAPEGTVLSDEVTAVRIDGDRVLVSPTPFWGDLRRSRAAQEGPLRALISLGRERPRSCDEAKPAPMLALLMHCVFAFEGGVVDKQSLLTTMRDLVDRVPLYDLHYEPTMNPWPLVESVLSTREREGRW